MGCRILSRQSIARFSTIIKHVLNTKLLSPVIVVINFIIRRFVKADYAYVTRMIYTTSDEL